MTFPDLDEKKAMGYDQDMRGIAMRYVAGKDNLVAENLAKWSQLHDKKVKEMWGDCVAFILKDVLPLLRHRLEGMQGRKERGEETYYKYDPPIYNWGRIPIDEAISRQKALIERCEGTVIEPPVGKEKD